uniref:Uncharacterized protein n=1 Tax=Sus scrofa TaxID=9823 RepID=A0A8D1Q9U1_PIG
MPLLPSTALEAGRAGNMVYPLCQLGNPQLPPSPASFFVRLVWPGLAQPEGTVPFWVPTEVTSVDLKNDPSAFTMCSTRGRDYRNVRIKRLGSHVAFEHPVHRQTFPFPELFLENKIPEGSSVDGDLRDLRLEDQGRRQSRDPLNTRPGLVSDRRG